MENFEHRRPAGFNVKKRPQARTRTHAHSTFLHIRTNIHTHRVRCAYTSAFTRKHTHTHTHTKHTHKTHTHTHTHTHNGMRKINQTHMHTDTRTHVHAYAHPHTQHACCHPAPAPQACPSHSPHCEPQQHGVSSSLQGTYGGGTASMCAHPTITEIPVTCTLRVPIEAAASSSAPRCPINTTDTILHARGGFRRHRVHRPTCQLLPCPHPAHAQPPQPTHRIANCAIYVAATGPAMRTAVAAIERGGGGTDAAAVAAGPSMHPPRPLTVPSTSTRSPLPPGTTSSTGAYITGTRASCDSSRYSRTP